MRKTKLFFLSILTCLILSSTNVFSQAVGDYGSAVATGNWTTNGTWVVCTAAGTWTGATVATANPGTSTNVYIRNGHTITFDTSSKTCNNLTIDLGGVLSSTATFSSPKYLKVSGTSITVNGQFGGSSTDGLGIGLSATANQTLTISGSGTINIGRLQPNAASQTVIMDANASFNYNGSSGTGGVAIYNNTYDNYIFQINATRIITTSPNVYIGVASSSGSAVPTTGYNITLNVYGTLTTGAAAHINLLNASNKTSTLNIYNGGVVNCGGNLLMPTASTTSTGVLNIVSGGALNINTGSIFKIGGIATTFTNSGTTNINGSFQIDEGLNTITGNNLVYGAAGTLIFNNATTTNFTVPGFTNYWPATGGPVNVTVQSTGGFVLPFPAAIPGTLTVATGGILKTGVNTFTNSNIANINGSFQIDESGWATGNNFVYGTAGTLVFNNTSVNYGVGANPAYWPSTSGPVNVTVMGGGIQLQASQTVTGTFQTSASVGNTFGNNLTVSGSVKLNSGGYFSNFSPTYTNTGTLVYNTTGSYGVNNEWLSGTTAGYGVPQNVTVLNATLVNLSGSRTIPGTLALTSGKIDLGANNLTVASTGSITGASATGYIVTDGAGTLTQTIGAGAAATFPIGASTASYDPATLTPTNATDVAVNVGLTLPAVAAADYSYNAKVWNVTPTAPSSTIVTLTPSAAVTTIAGDVIGQYISGSYVNSPATRTGTGYTATFTTFAPFVTGTTDLGTSISQTRIAGVYFDGLTIHNDAKLNLQVYDATGRMMLSSVKDINMSSSPKGVYVVKSNSGSLKIVL